MVVVMVGFIDLLMCGDRMSVWERKNEAVALFTHLEYCVNLQNENIQIFK